MTEYSTVNDEPGIMIPGLCFTIEVSTSKCLGQKLTDQAMKSHVSFKVPIPMGGCSQMVGRFQQRFVWVYALNSNFSDAPLISQNCARSAQAEHMVLITETGAEVLTRTRSW